MAEKVTIFSWHTSQRELKAIKECGYNHNQVLYDVDEFKVARNLFEKNVNIVLLKAAHGEVLVGVADDLFKQ